jgi:hypothetical protein
MHGARPTRLSLSNSTHHLYHTTHNKNPRTRQDNTRQDAPELVVHARKLRRVVEAPGADGVGPLLHAAPPLLLLLLLWLLLLVGRDEEGLEAAERAEDGGVVRGGGVAPAAGEGVRLGVWYWVCVWLWLFWTDSVACREI